MTETIKQLRERVLGLDAEQPDDCFEKFIERQLSFTCEQTGKRYKFTSTAELICAFLKLTTERESTQPVDWTKDFLECWNQTMEAFGKDHPYGDSDKVLAKAFYKAGYTKAHRASKHESDTHKLIRAQQEMLERARAALMYVRHRDARWHDDDIVTPTIKAISDEQEAV